MRQTTGVGGGESAQREVTGADVGVELVLAASILLERAEQAAVGFAERRGLKAAGHDGGVDIAVVRRIADGDGQVAEVEFDVFVAGNATTERSPAGMRTKRIAALGISMVTSRLFLGPPKTRRSPSLPERRKRTVRSRALSAFRPLKWTAILLLSRPTIRNSPERKCTRRLLPEGKSTAKGWF